MFYKGGNAGLLFLHLFVYFDRDHLKDMLPPRADKNNSMLAIAFVCHDGLQDHGDLFIEWAGIGCSFVILEIMNAALTVVLSRTQVVPLSYAEPAARLTS